MRDEKLITLKKLMVGLAAYYGHPIDDYVVSMYAEDLADLPLEAVLQAAREIRLDPKTSRFPLPALIRERASPVISDTDLSRDIAARIFKAIGRHGHNWSDKDANWPSQAIAELSDLGFEVVKRLGGWFRVCEFSGDVSLGIFMAQVRDLAESTLKSVRAGHLGRTLALSDPQSKLNQLTSIDFTQLLQRSGG
jgi:hypothetical protein